MGTSHPPFMYRAERRDDARFPGSVFDPKAVTRASWEPKPRKPQPGGPLITFNRHPDAHLPLARHADHRCPLGPRTKDCIKRLRQLQLVLRVLELNGAAGTLALMVLMTKVEAVTAWTLRIAPAVSMMHSIYAIYHLSRGASGRTPASSAAYQVFAALADLCIVSAYAFGAFASHKSAASWATRLSDQHLMSALVPAVYYLLICVASLHLASLVISAWLGSRFRNISLMPPDMNPLEDHLTARPFHRRNKSSITTTSSIVIDDELDDDASRPPSIPFMRTRAGSRPSRQYQLVPRHSVEASAAVMSAMPRSSQWPLHSGLPNPCGSASPLRTLASNDAGQARMGKFTETWLPTDSLMSRTDERNRHVKAAAMASACGGCNVPRRQLYSSPSQRYGCALGESSGSEYECEGDGASDAMHPNPLGSHPPWHPKSRIPPGRGSSERRVSNSKDIADQPLERRGQWRRHRQTSIQAEDDFCSRPYRELKCATPPAMIGGSRKISSSNDYESRYSSSVYERRNVSGKQAEEGQAATRILKSSAKAVTSS